MLAAATSFFARTAIYQSYNIGTSPGSRPSTPGNANTSLSAVTLFSPPLNVGLWKVQSASHKVTNKRVSVWSFDKRRPDMDRLSVLARDRTLEILKAEVVCKWVQLACNFSTFSQASALGRLRHPSILGKHWPI